MSDAAALEGFTHTTFTHDGKARDVYRTGSGPAVIVIAEIPGITPKIAEFGRRVADLGCTAVLPRLFGVPGGPQSAGNVIRRNNDLMRLLVHRQHLPGEMILPLIGVDWLPGAGPHLSCRFRVAPDVGLG